MSEHSHRPARRRLAVCHVLYAFYESDTRVRMYAEALVERGDRVDAVALRKPGQPATGILEGVRIHRIQERVVNENGRADYLKRILRFFLASAVFLGQRSLNSAGSYDLVHVHSVPDFEVFAALVPKLRGAKVILDIHDLVPEFYADKFGVDSQSAVFGALRLAEKASSAFADHVIVANHLWERVITKRAVQTEKCSVFLNYPMPAFFRRYPRRSRDDGRVRMIYPGTLNRHQGVDLAVRAIGLIRDRIPAAELYIYGDGPDRSALQDLIRELRLEDRVFIQGFLPIEEIVPVIADADIGIVPKRAEGFGDTAFSTKILEFMALGVPVIAARTTIDSYYFNDTLVRFFEPGSVESLAEAMLDLVQSTQRRDLLARNAAAYARRNAWETKKDEYLRLVDRLIGNR